MVFSCFYRRPSTTVLVFSPPLSLAPLEAPQFFILLHAARALPFDSSVARFVCCLASPARPGGFCPEELAGEPAAGLSHVLAALPGVPGEVGADGAVRRLVAHASGSEICESLYTLWK